MSSSDSELPSVGKRENITTADYDVLLLRHWDDLSASEQSGLLIEFGYYQDGFPRTCSIQLKVERFRAWLLERDVDYT